MDHEEFQTELRMSPSRHQPRLLSLSQYFSHVIGGTVYPKSYQNGNTDVFTSFRRRQQQRCLYGGQARK